MNLERDPRIYLDDILDAARKAIEFTEGLSFEDFVADDRTTFAVIRAFEILGEAAAAAASPRSSAANRYAHR